MARSTTRKRRATLAGIALSLVLMAAGSLPALAGGYVAKTFTMNVTPTPVVAGHQPRVLRGDQEHVEHLARLDQPDRAAAAHHHGRERLQGHRHAGRQPGAGPHRGVGGGQVDDHHGQRGRPVQDDHPHLVRHGDVGIQLHRHHVRPRHDEEHEDHQGERDLHARVRGRTSAGERASERGHLVGRLRPERRAHPGEGPRRLGQSRRRSRPASRWPSAATPEAARSAEPRRRRPAAGSRRSTT